MIALMGVAMAATIQSEICIEFDVEFDEAYSAGDAFAFGVGDVWDDNTVNRPAKYSWIDVNSTWQLLNANGCATLELDPLASHVVTLHPLGLVRGTPTVMKQQPEGALWPTATSPTIQFTGVTVKPSSPDKLFVVAAVGGWQHVAVATHVADLMDWGLDERTTRDCCLNSNNANGVCTDPTKFYDTSYPPYGPGMPTLNLRAPIGSKCCASDIAWTSPNEKRSGLSVGTSVQERMSMAHELGHVFAGLRIGGKESWSNNAAHDQCVGDMYWNSTTGNWQLLEPAGGVRGVFTKEYGSGAFREGWGNFMRAYAFNTATRTDPQLAEAPWLYSDFDLDGDPENRWANNQYPYNRAHRLGVTPEIEQSFAWDTTSAWALGLPTNWLGRAIDVGACDTAFNSIDPACKFQKADLVSRNRSTVFDVSNMFWDLQHGGIPPNDLLDIYVNACPREWQSGDKHFGVCSTGPALPYERLLQGALHEGYWNEMNDALGDHVEH